MAEFNIRSDAVDVEQIMEQIRARLREKRDVDYTEEQIRELASVKLDRFLDPRNVRSELLDHYRKQRDSAAGTVADAFDPPVAPRFDPDDVYRSSRGGIGGILRGIRRLLRPILKLFINPGPALETVRALSEHAEDIRRALTTSQKQRAELDILTYEVLNNLVVEMTRLAIDLKNHKMRVESVAARLDFDERRSRALEEIVQFRASAPSGEASAATGSTERPGSVVGGEGTPERKRRRRRGRRRRSGNGAVGAEAAVATAGENAPDSGETASTGAENPRGSAGTARVGGGSTASGAEAADGGGGESTSHSPADRPDAPGAAPGSDAQPAPAGDATADPAES